MKITSDLLIKFHKGECSQLEIEAIELWINDPDYDQPERVLLPEREEEILKDIWQNLLVYMNR